MKYFKPLFFIVLLSTVVADSFAKSPVWKVSKGDDFLYLGGTVHVLSKNDYPLPSSFEIAYKSADDVVFETDMVALAAPELQGQLLDAISYQDHRGLSSVLNREVYEQFGDLLQSRGVSIAVFDRFTPAGAIMTLTQFELGRLGLVDGDGVDAHFSKRVQKDNKGSIFLESFDEQIGFIQSMNELDANAVVRSGMSDINKLENLWSELLNAWRSGDLNSLEKAGIDEIRRDFPSLYKTILVTRNNAWFKKIEAMMLSEEKEFILVGVLHMAGDQGLIHLLKEAGYDIKQLD